MSDQAPASEVGHRIASPSYVYEAALGMRTLGQEYFMSLHRDSKNPLNAVEIIAVRKLNASLVHQREVSQRAILNSASSLIVAHSHPSADPKPSEEDVRLTRRLTNVGEMPGVPLMDHVVIGRDTCRSLREEGIIGGKVGDPCWVPGPFRIVTRVWNTYYAPRSQCESQLIQ